MFPSSVSVPSATTTTAGGARNSLEFHLEIYRRFMASMVAHRMTGDHAETGTNVGDLPREKPSETSSTANLTGKKKTFKPTPSADAKRNTLYNKFPSLVGNDLFLQPLQLPRYHARIPATGTGTCRLPTTCEILARYFSSTKPWAKAVFTDAFEVPSHTTLEALEAAMIAIFGADTKNSEPYFSLSSAKVNRADPIYRLLSVRINFAMAMQLEVKQRFARLSVQINREHMNKNSAAVHQSDVKARNMAHDFEKNMNTLRQTVADNKSTVFDVNLGTMPNCNVKHTQYPIQADEFDPFFSPDLPYTYHHMWALYYWRLLEKFIIAHGPYCQWLTQSQQFMAPTLAPPPRSAPPPAFYVPTTYQAFDAVYAEWHWVTFPTPTMRPSFQILSEIYPYELVFQKSLHALYLEHKYEDDSAARAFVLAVAKEMCEEDETYVLPPSLVGEEWRPPSSHQNGCSFLWTLLASLYRIEQLKTQAPACDNDYIARLLQVRLTGYLPVVRWVLKEILIENAKIVFDSQVPEVVKVHPCDIVEFDADRDLPDLASAINKLNFWHRQIPEQESDVIRNFLQKCIRFRSHGRVLSDVVADEIFYRNPYYCNIISKVVAASTMGLYPRHTATSPMFRPSVSGLIKVDFAMLQSPRLLFNFIHVTKSRVFIYMSREWMVNALARFPTLRENQVIDYPTFELDTWNVQNMLRQHVEYHSFWLRAPHNPARLDLEQRIGTIEKPYKMLYRQHNFVHTLLELFQAHRIQHRIHIIDLQVNIEAREKALKRHNNTTGSEDDHLQLQHLKNQLRAIDFHVPEEIRRAVWQSAIGMRKDLDIWAILRQWISDDDLILFRRLVDEYEGHASKAKFDSVIQHFAISSFIILHYALHVQSVANGIKRIGIGRGMTQNIRTAMRTKRFYIVNTEPLSSLVYNIYITFCCQRVLTLSGTRSYGNSNLMYDDSIRGYVCCLKSTKKQVFTLNVAPGVEVDLDVEAEGEEEEEEEDDDDVAINVVADEDEDGEEDEVEEEERPRKRRKQTFTPASALAAAADTTFATQMDKSRRKIARRYEREVNPLTCKRKPPVLCMNMEGFRLYYGRERHLTKAYQHCPRCGDWHEYQDRNAMHSGQGYMCTNCNQRTWQPSPWTMQESLCIYCGRHHFRSVDKGLSQVPMIDTSDHVRPIKVVFLCQNDVPKFGADYYKNRLFIDYYLHWHESKLPTQSRSHFPYDALRPGQEAKIKDKSWVSYGQRFSHIALPLDEWQPPSTHQ